MLASTGRAYGRCMNQIASPSKRRRVVIAGGGIAAVETLLALRSLAPTTQLDVVVVAPNEDLHYRPSTVNEPFSEPRARRYRLQAICDDLGAVLHAEPVRVVDGARREIATASGERIAYDALVLAVGARPRPAIAHAHTFFADIRAVAGLPEAAGIAILCSTYVTAFDGRRLTLAPGGRSLEVDAALALPELHGPALPGVP